MDMRMRVEQKSDQGLVREENQDNLGWFTTTSGELFIVADGMGGEAGGRRAADLAISTIKEIFQESQGSILELLGYSIEEANRRIFLQGSSGDPMFHKMGTTVVILVIKDNKAYIAHAGDSRIYLHRDNRLYRLTNDHSMVQAMVDKGMLPPDEAENHPNANVITRCLGAKANIEPEIRSEPIEIGPGDLFLLCTDGLCGLAKDNEIVTVISRGDNLKAIVDGLIALALGKGGHDNVTVQGVFFDGKSSRRPRPLVSDRVVGHADLGKSRNTKAAIIYAGLGILFTVGAALGVWFFTPLPKTLFYHHAEEIKKSGNKATVPEIPDNSKVKVKGKETTTPHSGITKTTDDGIAPTGGAVDGAGMKATSKQGTKKVQKKQADKKDNKLKSDSNQPIGKKHKGTNQVSEQRADEPLKPVEVPAPQPGNVSSQLAVPLEQAEIKTKEMVFEDKSKK